MASCLSARAIVFSKPRSGHRDHACLPIAASAYGAKRGRNLLCAAAFSLRNEMQEAVMPFLFWATVPFELMKAWCEAFEHKRERQ
jgi:hypothetical protein